MKKIILIGAGGHCRSCIDVIKSTERYSIVGIINKDKASQLAVDGIPIIGTDKNINTLAKKFNYFHITIGQIRTANNRTKIFEKLKKLEVKLDPIFSSTCYISPTSKILSGSIVMHQAFINVNSVIGENTIVNTQAIIEHDCKIGNNCHISTGVKINGSVTIGDNTFIGSGSIIYQGVTIGSKSIISAGSIVRENVKSRSLFRNDINNVR